MSARDSYELSCMALDGRKGAAVVLKAYVDESGIHDGSPVVTVGAYIARPKTWREWTRRWNIAKKLIRIFHATDAQNFQGEFRGWSPAARDALVIRVLNVIAKTENLRGIVIGLNLDEYNKAMKGRNDLERIFGTPYGACFQWLIQTIMFLQSRAKSSERIAFIHENNDFQGEALQSFDYVNKYSNPMESRISITFGSKEQFAPLQAADVIAYEGNKRMRDPSRPERRSWQAINHDKRILAAHYGRNNMPELISRLEKIRDGRIEEIVNNPDWRQFLMNGFCAT